jgi:hypothetical protein
MVSQKQPTARPSAVFGYLLFKTIYPSYFLQQRPPRDFPMLTAYNALPIHPISYSDNLVSARKSV